MKSKDRAAPVMLFLCCDATGDPFKSTIYLSIKSLVDKFDGGMGGERGVRTRTRGIPWCPMRDR